MERRALESPSVSLPLWSLRIVQRILRAFYGARVLFSRRAMLASVVLLGVHCEYSLKSQPTKQLLELTSSGAFCRCRR